MTETPIGERVENGIRWLVAHDPHGAYHLWYTAKILPGTPMPAQPVEAQEEYRVYYKGREQWDRLYRAWEAQEIDKA